jgi:hypothetical protein
VNSRANSLAWVLNAVFFTWVVLANSAVAQVPAAPRVPSLCTGTSKLSTKYNTGLTLGQQRADTFFASTEVAKSPKKLATKLSRALVRLHDHIRDALQPDTREGRRCRIQGVADGFLYRLAQLLGQCVLDGAQWGQFAANLYCELSIELDGLGVIDAFTRAPAGLCGTLFEQTCDAVYAYVATGGEVPLMSSVGRFASDRGVTLTPYPGCSEFTEGAFLTVFEGARELDCSYE